MRSRPSSRLLLIDPEQRVLLFRFVHNSDALAGKSYWGTPGGGLEEGEDFVAAARRELEEETGLRVDHVGEEVGRRSFELMMPSGETVMADERFFAVAAPGASVSWALWTAQEREVMYDHRWWSATELLATTETVYPEDMAALLAAAAAALRARSPS